MTHEQSAGVTERIQRIKDAYDREREEGEDADRPMCDLCELFVAKYEEVIEAEESGRKMRVGLCGTCHDKTERHSRGEDVDFSNELRLNKMARGEK